MPSHLEELAKEESKMDMTPMIDVTFQLLIFFMCTIKFKTLEGKLSAYLPKDLGSAATQATPKEKVEIKLTVLNEGQKLDPRTRGPWTGEGRFEYDQSRVVQYQVGPMKTTSLQQILERLKALHADDPERGSTINAQKGIVYGDVVGVLDAALVADFTEITFVGSAE